MFRQYQPLLYQLSALLLLLGWFCGLNSVDSLLTEMFLIVISTLSTKYNCNTKVVVFTLDSQLLQVLGMYSIDTFGNTSAHVLPSFFTIKLVFLKTNDPPLSPWFFLLETNDPCLLDSTLRRIIFPRDK